MAISSIWSKEHKSVPVKTKKVLNGDNKHYSEDYEDEDEEEIIKLEMKLKEKEVKIQELVSILEERTREVNMLRDQANSHNQFMQKIVMELIQKASEKKPSAAEACGPQRVREWQAESERVPRSADRGEVRPRQNFTCIHA